ncbi:MAG TPA: heme-copper oxidase subunit III [Acidimicrobiales bacterium]|nr:heme-copper oxidase subunit III [Acidimicrobiales bacterium]
MTAISTTGAVSPPAPALRHVDPSMYRPKLLQVGVIVWLASELMFFSGLFAAYFSIRSASVHSWPPRGDELDVPPVLIATILLVLSSFTMQYGVHRAIRGSKWGFVGWTMMTFVLGTLFDGMQVSDYIGRHFGIDTDAYGSCFYTLTGFHFLHVAGGLVAMIIVMIRVLRSPRFGHRTMPAIEMLSYYWHFVDVVWIAMFLAIFVLK